MTNEEYWKKRNEDLEALWFQKCQQEIEQELLANNKQALAHIEDKIAALYARFAKDNKLDLLTAQRLLQGDEYRTWRMDLESYVKEISETGNTELERELNILAMRSRITRLDKLKADIILEIARLAAKQGEQIDKFLPTAYTDFYYHNLFDIGQRVGLQEAVTQVGSEQVEKVLRTPWSGKNYSQRIWTNSKKLVDVIQREIVGAVTRGATIQGMSRVVQQRMQVGRHEAVRLVRTELSYVENRGAFDSIKESGMKYYRFIATLDRRTSTQCRSHDGHVYLVDEYSPGSNAPPLHPHCRSTISASLHGPDGKQLGKRAARDTKTDKTVRVPAELRYDDWKSIYIDQGVTYHLWKQGKENFAHHNLRDIIEIRHTNLHEEPYAVTKYVSKKGSTDWNFYDSQGNQYLQVSNSDHGHKEEAGFGEHGEHAHWYNLSSKPRKVHDKAVEVPSYARKAMGDIL